MQFQHPGRHLVEAEAGEPAGRIAEGKFADVLAQSHHFKQFRAPIRRNRADPHLRHHLEQTGLERRPVVLLGHNRVDIDHALLGQRPHLVDGQIGIHGRGTGGDQHCQVVGIAGFPGDHDHRGLDPDTGLDEGVMNRSHGQHHRHRSVERVHLTVGEDDQGGAAGHRLYRLVGDPTQRPGHAGRAFGGGPGGGDPIGKEARVRAADDRRELGVGQDRRRQLDQMGGGVGLG
jgi:hypothetical protein